MYAHHNAVVQRIYNISIYSLAFSEIWSWQRVLFASASNPLWHFRRFKVDAPMYRVQTRAHTTDKWFFKLIFRDEFFSWRNRHPHFKKLICLFISSMIISIGCVFDWNFCYGKYSSWFCGISQKFSSLWAYEAINDNGLIYRKSFCWLIHFISFHFEVLCVCAWML